MQYENPVISREKNRFIHFGKSRRDSGDVCGRVITNVLKAITGKHPRTQSNYLSLSVKTLISMIRFAHITCDSEEIKRK